MFLFVDFQLGGECCAVEEVFVAAKKRAPP